MPAGVLKKLIFETSNGDCRYIYPAEKDENKKEFVKSPKTIDLFPTSV